MDMDAMRPDLSSKVPGLSEGGDDGDGGLGDDPLLLHLPEHPPAHRSQSELAIRSRDPQQPMASWPEQRAVVLDEAGDAGGGVGGAGAGAVQLVVLDHTRQLLSTGRKYAFTKT